MSDTENQVEFEDISSSSAPKNNIRPNDIVKIAADKTDEIADLAITKIDKVIKIISFIVAIGIFLVFLAVAAVFFILDSSFLIISIGILILGIVLALISLFIIYGIGQIITQNNQILKYLKYFNY